MNIIYIILNYLCMGLILVMMGVGIVLFSIIGYGVVKILMEDWKEERRKR